MGKYRYLIYFIVFLLGFTCAYFLTTKYLVFSTDLSREEIAGVKLHDNIEDSSFLALYDKPISKQDNNSLDYYQWSKGFETASIINGQNKGEIVRLIILDTEKKESNRLKTKKGIEIGDSKKKIRSRYGENYYNRREQGIHIIGYKDRKTKRTLEFWLFNDKVTEVRLEDARASSN